jgi:hypothetical protein
MPAQAEPSLQSLRRLPQGLGGPNIAAPTALERLRARHAAPPQGVPAVPRLPRYPQFEGDVAVMALRHRLSLQPEIVPAPPMRRRSSSSIMPSLGRFSLVMLVASSVALTVVLLTLPDTRPVIFRSENNPVAGTARLASAPAAPRTLPRLIAVDGRRTFTNEALALGITLNGATGSELALLSGLVSGTRLSVGSPIGANGWKLAARDLASALAYAPKDFVGVMNAAIDLRLPDDRLVDSRVMRLEWIPRPPEVQARVQPPKTEEAKTQEAKTRETKTQEAKTEEAKTEEAKTEEARPAIAVRTVEQPEIAALVKRGQDYLQSGDIVSARLMLRRAASAGSAQAALMLGASFDPIVLRDLGVLGFSPDPEQARVWYRRAAEYGSSEATRRLDRLANVSR